MATLDHPHDHEHHDDPDHHDHDAHDHGTGFWEIVQGAFPFLGGHSHSHGELPIDDALESNTRGIQAVRLSLGLLGLTALFQVIIALASGSAGLLADTIHNFSDALTAIPLWIAFALGRRLATRRFTYGYGRAEDIAGVVIVLMILGSALVAAYESYLKLVNPQPLTNVAWVMVAAMIGFFGNEAVAIFRMRVGQQIGSAALIADGKHAQIDGFTSLAVFIGALGNAIGIPVLDPIIGLLITLAILFIVKDTLAMMWQRLMDAIDPSITAAIGHEAAEVPGVQAVNNVRGRWFGHSLLVELNVVVDEDLSTLASHQIAEDVRHALFHDQPRLGDVTVHIEPCGHHGGNPHETTAHHVRFTTPTSERNRSSSIKSIRL